MKKLAALLLAVCMLAGAALAFAENVRETAWTNCRANVRKGPSTRNDILFELEEGAAVEICETLTENGVAWCQIVVAGTSRSGYILKELLDIGGAAPQEKADLTIISSPATAPAETVWREARTKCGVNLRKSPSATGVKLDELPALTDLLAAEADGEWTQVRVPSTGQEGYVQANLLDYAPQKPAAPAEAVQEAAVIQPQEKTQPAKRYSDDTNLSRRIDSSYYYYLLGEGAGEEPALFDNATLANYTTLDVGSSGDNVLALKQRLTALDYYRDYISLSPDYSESTKEYVARFQKVNGLEQTGVADPTTQAMMYSDDALGASEEGRSRLPINLRSARIVSYHDSSAVQVEFDNDTGEALSGFALKIIPYSAYGEATGLAETLQEQAARTYEKRITVAEGSAYSDSARGNYFVIEQDQYFAGALVSVCSYTTTAGKTVYIDSSERSWVTAGTAVAADAVSAGYKGRKLSEDKWDMGFECEYVLPVYRRTYSAPEGLVVTKVENGNYGKWAGLQPGDVLLVMNTTELTSTAALRQEKETVAMNGTFELVFWRDGLYYAATLQK